MKIKNKIQQKNRPNQLRLTYQIEVIRPGQLYRKQIETIYEAQISMNLMLKVTRIMRSR